MSSNPSVSVIIATHNHEKYIGRCIRSLLNQDLDPKEFEVIVVNDGSTDKTDEVIENFKKQVQIIRNKKNIGLPASLNKGIKKARSPYLVRVDSDDYVNSAFLSLLLRFLLENPEMDAIGCDYFEINDKEEVIRKVSCDDEPIACGIMFRIEHLIEIGLYDEEFLLFEERDLRNRFEKKFKIERLRLPLYRYRKHDSNITKDVNAKEKFEKLYEKKHGTSGDI
jgi:glycosyltransferase involved in cell wall biosynthesis